MQTATSSVRASTLSIGTDVGSVPLGGPSHDIGSGGGGVKDSLKVSDFSSESRVAASPA